MTKTTKKKRAIKPAPSNQDCCGAPISIRRSIPAKEVAEMLNKQREELIKEPTLWDRRVDLISRIHDVQDEIHRYKTRLAELNALEIQFQKDLKEVVEEIGAALNLDHLH